MKWPKEYLDSRWLLCVLLAIVWFCLSFATPDDHTPIICSSIFAAASIIISAIIKNKS